MIRTWFRVNRSLVAALTSGTVIAAIVATIAIASTGYRAQRLDLDDASVWVASSDRGAVARANTALQQLDSVISIDGTEIRLVQDGLTIYVQDVGNSRLDVVDPATSVVLDSIPLPPDRPDVLLSGDRLVILAGTGSLWLVDIAKLDLFSAEQSPTAEFGDGAIAALSPDGDLFIFAPALGVLHTLDVGTGASLAPPRTVTAPGGRNDFQLSAVGDRWVLLDQSSRQLFTESGSLSLEEQLGGSSSVLLQQSSTAADDVLIAHGGGLLSVPLAATSPRVLVSGLAGAPIAPVAVDGCRYAVWGDGTEWRQCGSADPELAMIDGIPSGADLAIQRNGRHAVLNDIIGGGSWAIQGDGGLIDNWEELLARNDDTQTEINDEESPPEYEKVQTPPIAVDDVFGVRPGRSVTLPVLLNDYDPNGDVLVIDSLGAVPAGFNAQRISNNQELQLDIPPSATGTVTIDYSISDGRGGSDSAVITVNIRSREENSAPVQVRSTRQSVQSGGRFSVNILADWIDPDGDPVYLTRASTAAPDAVSFRPEGTIVYIDAGQSVGAKTVSTVVSDGSLEGFGSVPISVRQAGQVPIVTDPFAVIAYAGQETTVAVLDHVRGGSGAIRLNAVSSGAGYAVVPNYETGGFRFTSSVLGTRYVEYSVTDGDLAATGLVRLEVVAPPELGSPPVTVPVVVFVETQSTKRINVLEKDFDPAGGVLLVTDVDEMPVSSGVRVEVIDHRDLRITLTAPLIGPVTFNYRVSNGYAAASGTVAVIEIPRPVVHQPPVANDDFATVRVGDTIDIPVLGNDEQPDGEDFSLDPELAQPLPAGSGLLFASGSVLRYLAPERPGNFTALYTVRTPSGQSATGFLQIAVRELDTVTNAAPVARTVTARVNAGESVTIRIPLTGIDPDGDSVTLLGQETNPAMGSVTTSGDDFLIYQSELYATGTDTFRYTVIDSSGARSTGTIRVGIAARDNLVRNPIAVADDVRVRPGRTVSVQVLANDTDPAGSPLTIIEDSLELSAPEMRAQVNGEVLEITPPAVEGSYSVLYSIRNQYGGEGSAFVTVTVDSAAPLAWPIVTDSVLNLSDILGRQTVNVDVLSRVFWSDGDPADLTVSVLPGYGSTATVLDSKRIRVAVGERNQIIPFALTHPEDAGIVAYAFIRVPGLEDALPQVDRTAPLLVVESQKELLIDLNDYVLTARGGRVLLTDSSTVQATHSNGTSLTVDQDTLRFVSADNYFGPASISFQVTDGDSPTDPAGRIATLVLPITVLPSKNTPPVFQGASVTIEPDQSRVFDLTQLTLYPFPADVPELRYTVISSSPGMNARLDGQVLTVTASPEVPRNTTGTVAIGVRDLLNDGVSGRIELTMVASGRPLAVPQADQQLTLRGQATSIDVLANDAATNPFPATPLRVISVRGANGQSLPAGVTITPSADKSQLLVQVAASAATGEITLQYQVADATNDPDRYTWGTVTISIQDVPSQPLAPQRRSGGFENGILALAITPPEANNSPITNYRVVSADNGGYTKDCGTLTICVLSDLQPGEPYRFQVIATNAIGDSTPSALSAVMTADYLPSAPNTVTVTPIRVSSGVAAVTVAWSSVPNPNPGTAVTGYVVLLDGAGTTIGKSLPAGATSTNFTGLPADTVVTATVYAVNSASVSSDAEWLRTAASARTIGEPISTPPTATADTSGSGSITIQWQPSSPNGAPTVTYSIGRVSGTAPAPSCTPGPGEPAQISADSVSGLSWVDSGAADGQSYTYFLYADNGLYCTATASSSVVSLFPPGAATATVELVQDDSLGRRDIRISSLGVSSGTAVRYQYSIDGAAWADIPGNGMITSPATQSLMGLSHAVTVRGCRDASIDSLCGPAGSPSASLTPLVVRTTVVSCVAGAPVVITAPANATAAGQSVDYAVAWDIGEAGPASFSHTIDEVLPVGILNVLVKATVTVPTASWTDPRYGEAPCR